LFPGIGEAIYETGAAIANKAASMVTPSKSSDTLADQTPGMGELPGTKGPVVPGSEPAPGVAGTYGNVGFEIDLAFDFSMSNQKCSLSYRKERSK
jgi:hypothetical protein